MVDGAIDDGSRDDRESVGDTNTRLLIYLGDHGLDQLIERGLGILVRDEQLLPPRSDKQASKNKWSESNGKGSP